MYSVLELVHAQCYRSPECIGFNLKFRVGCLTFSFLQQLNYRDWKRQSRRASCLVSFRCLRCYFRCCYYCYRRQRLSADCCALICLDEALCSNRHHRHFASQEKTEQTARTMERLHGLSRQTTAQCCPAMTRSFKQVKYSMSVSSQ